MVTASAACEHLSEQRTSLAEHLGEIIVTRLSAYGRSVDRWSGARQIGRATRNAQA